MAYDSCLTNRYLIQKSLILDVTNRTKSNVRLIELTRTQSNPITRLGSIEFDNRTQSNPHKKIGLIEPNRTFEWVRLVRLGSIEFDGFHHFRFSILQLTHCIFYSQRLFQ